MLMTTAKQWYAANPFRQSALIAYYAIFSIPGLLMMITWLAGYIFGEAAIQNEITAQIGEIMGAEAAGAIENIMINARLDDSGLLMRIVGAATLIFGATTLFFNLQQSLNYIWDVKAAPKNGFKKLLIDRATGLGLILIIAFLLLITLVITAVLSVIANWIEQNFGQHLLRMVELMNFLVSLGIVTLLFAVMFKFLPDVEISWKSVWVGAIVTALLFTIGKTLLGLYFGFADPTSSYGVAGAVILIMIWVNYSCLILFFGAEFTQVYARRYHHNIVPSKHATWMAHRILQDWEEQVDQKKGQ